MFPDLRGVALTQSRAGKRNRDQYLKALCPVAYRMDTGILPRRQFATGDGRFEMPLGISIGPDSPTPFGGLALQDEHRRY